MDMTPAELGESLAQLVWESFTDFIAAHEMPDEDGGDTAVLTAPEVVPEEVLILFMWVHTRACQQAFNGRAPADELKAVLDQFHAAVFQDLQDEILPRAQLPIFEQRVSARYTEYYEAASQNADERIVEVAARRVTPDQRALSTISLELAEATAAAAGPLRDFLEDVDIGSLGQMD
ncbi:MAG: hypothetical protein P8Z36_01805 [Gemmatimonadota bacterium]|jgi:hypothetical protein